MTGLPATAWSDTAVFAGLAVDGTTGRLVRAAGCSVNWEPVLLPAGAVVAPLPGFEMRLWAYGEGFDEALVREYGYDGESNWTTPAPGRVPAGWHATPVGLPAACYLRIGMRRLGGGSAPADTLGKAVSITGPALPPPVPASWFAAEADAVCARVAALRDPGDAVFLVVSDIHYSTGCIWPQTAVHLSELAQRLQPQAIVQLGDVTDGLAPAPVTLSFARRVLADLAGAGVPVLGCIGNHDFNYFQGNGQPFSEAECARLYLGGHEPWHHVDFASRRLRCLLLHSFDPTTRERYGFPLPELFWVERMLRETPAGWKVLVFSHVPPAAEIHYWSESILNGEALLRLLARFDARRGGAVLGVVHGHNHADQVHRRAGLPFPLVSVGCAKFEDFAECKPEGSFTPPRRLGDASQDLLDVLVVKPGAARLEFVRFGAGDDRSVDARG